MFKSKKFQNTQEMAISYLRSLENKDYKALLAAVNLYRKGDETLKRAQRSYGVDKVIDNLGGFIEETKKEEKK